MSTGRNTVTVYFVLAGGLLAIGLVLFAPLPAWGSLGVGSAFVITAGLLLRKGGPRRTPSRHEGFSRFGTEPGERHTASITDVLLPSSREDYFFLFSATVLWSPANDAVDLSGINMPALATDTVVQRARQITIRSDPGETSLVRHQLARLLGEMKLDSGDRLRAMAKAVRLSLPEHDQVRLDKLATVRKEEAVWEHERKCEQSKREYLGGDVLKDPGSAVVWWLTRNDGQMEKTVRDIDLLTRLTAAANNAVPQYVSEQHPPVLGPQGLSSNGKSAADHLDDFLQAMDFGEDDLVRDLFTQRVVDLLDTHERPDLAEEVARRFGTSDAGHHTPEQLPEA